ncbi:pseudouridylate synthase 1 homolog isoform X1 [Leptidea sinapis]|uniref:pseudouridylate synthase 1 homolog isoform X1 n=2 Tax=Leptidea sinapis TaxID=189913 RepID=UPI00213672AD|nr:pseudouridylate synthase 1 homolog isoform X1 [Leptidea sinapis]
MSARIFQTLINNCSRFNLTQRAIFTFTVSRLQRAQLLRMSTAIPIVEECEKVDKQNTRYMRRKRQWETNENKLEDGETDQKKTCENPVERIKRKKVAMLIGYCGVDYYGMQRNPGVKTIEEDLLISLRECNYITEADFVKQQNADFQRSSRTDKGVSAARQVVSLKLPLEADIEEINKHLPACIKVFGVKRTTNKFNSKSKCNARTYSYTLPTYVFEPKAVTEEERKNYRITAEKMSLVNEILSYYKGTKSFHNFTEKKHHNDPSASRYMMSFSLERVFNECEMEFAELCVKGQSFMLHQIRKMVGLMIAVVRRQAGLEMMRRVFGSEKLMLPTAPGLGLVLDKVHYERYDAKFKDSHENLTWEEVDPLVEAFKREHIVKSIVRGEVEEWASARWLEKLYGHSFEPAADVEETKEDTDERLEQGVERCDQGDERCDQVDQVDACLDKADECDGDDEGKEKLVIDEQANGGDVIDGALIEKSECVKEVGVGQ